MPKTPTWNDCRCGCGGATHGKFQPGHDAKFVSDAVRFFNDPDFAAGDKLGFWGRQLAKISDSPALQRKMRRAAANFATRAGLAAADMADVNWQRAIRLESLTRETDRDLPQGELGAGDLAAYAAFLGWDRGKVNFRRS